MATKKKPDMVKYKVTNPGITAISFGEEFYYVKDGAVEIPVGETWPRELVENGQLEILGANPELTLFPEES